MEDNKTLTNRIKNSGIKAQQKTNLIKLLPFMTNEEKEAVMKMIDKSNQMLKMQRDEYERLKAFKEEYKRKVKNKKHELIRYGQEQLHQAQANEAEELLKEIH